ncbi:PilZ domain-containing protein [Candidatus Nitrospira bockiana]
MNLRQRRRIHVECPLSFLEEEPTGEIGKQDSGRLVNLSSGGCAIESAMPVDKGRYLRMSIMLPGHERRLEVDLAKVRWTTQHGFGVEFLVLESLEQIRLRSFIAWRNEQGRAAAEDGEDHLMERPAPRPGELAAAAP